MTYHNSNITLSIQNKQLQIKTLKTNNAKELHKKLLPLYIDLLILKDKRAQEVFEPANELGYEYKSKYTDSIKKLQKEFNLL